MRRWFELLCEHKEDLARIMVAEQGAKFTHQVQHWYKLELRWDRHIINSILMIG